MFWFLGPELRDAFRPDGLLLVDSFKGAADLAVVREEIPEAMAEVLHVAADSSLREVRSVPRTRTGRRAVARRQEAEAAPHRYRCGGAWGRVDDQQRRQQAAARNSGPADPGLGTRRVDLDDRMTRRRRRSALADVERFAPDDRCDGRHRQSAVPIGVLAHDRGRLPRELRRFIGRHQLARQGGRREELLDVVMHGLEKRHRFRAVVLANLEQPLLTEYR